MQKQLKTKTMGTQITIIEAVIIGGLSLFVWLTINVLIEDFKSKIK